MLVTPRQIGGALLLAGVFGGAVHAQAVTESELKAAFVYNLAKFTEWPSETLPSGGRLVICVHGDGGVETALAQATKNKVIEGHPLVVQRLDAGAAAQGCHILFVSGSGARKGAGELVGPRATAPTLTVSDTAGFAQDGGVAELFIENAKMRLAINVDAARRSQVRINSQVLKLARIVTDGR